MSSQAGLCEEFSDIFATNPKSPQITSITTHVIDTGNSRPIKHKLRRVSPSTQQHIDEQVEEMMANGNCRWSESPWSSPVILVTKKVGGTRFVVDNQGLNSVTRKDAYPIPNPRDIFDRLSGVNYYSTLDCCSAISTSRGHYEMTRMALGICISQATYQRVIDKALKGLKSTQSYIH